VVLLAPAVQEGEKPVVEDVQEIRRGMVARRLALEQQLGKGHGQRALRTGQRHDGGLEREGLAVVRLC
jgi:hypothetical protein